MIKLNPYPYLAAVIAAMALYGAHRVVVVQKVTDAVHLSEQMMISKYNIKLLEAHNKAKQTETRLELSALALEKTKDEEIARINVSLDDALKRLRDRPVRPSTPNTPKDANAGEACTARELYREDAEFLTREAARANQVIAERNYYYQQYEKARKILNGIDATN